MIIALLGKKGAGKDTAGAVLAKELNGTCLAFADPMKRFCMKALGLTERQLWGSLKDKEKPVSKKQMKALRHVPRGPTDKPGSMYFPDPLWRRRWMTALVEACGEKAFEEPVTGFPGHTFKHGPWYVNEFNEGKILRWWDLTRVEVNLSARRILQSYGTEFGRIHLGADFWINVGLKTARKVLDGWAYDRVQGLAKRHGGSDAAVITDCRFRNEVLAVKRAGGKVYRVRRDFETTGSDKHQSEAEQEGIPDWWCDGVLYNTGTKKEFEEMVRDLAHEIATPDQCFPASDPP